MFEHCVAVDSAKILLDKAHYHLAKELIKEIPLCVAESKWMLCHIIFRACVYDKSTKSFRHLLPCQEICDLYLRRSKSCRKIQFQLLDWSQGPDSCVFPGAYILNCSYYPKKSSGICQDIPFNFRKKPNVEEMKVALSNKHKINTRWIYLGASLIVFCTAVAVAIGITRLGRKNSKDKEDHIQPYEKVGLKMDHIQPYEQPRLNRNNVIPEVHESGLLSTSFTLTN